MCLNKELLTFLNDMYKNTAQAGFYLEWLDTGMARGLELGL